MANKLIVLSGVPGSGKSYFSQAFRSAKGNHVYIVSSDALRDLVTGYQQDMSQDKLVWKMFYGLATIYALDPDGTVILDATNSICKYRTKIIEPFRKHFEEIDLVSFDLDKDIVRRQNLQRGFSLPPDVLEELFIKFEGPNEIDEKFFDKVVVIKDHNIYPIIDSL